MSTSQVVGSVGIVLVAAGSGSRLAAGRPKAFVPLAGKPILAHALRGALSCTAVAEVVVVAPATHLDEAAAVVQSLTANVCRSAGDPASRPALAAAPASPRVTVVAGGAERGESVVAGLRALTTAVDVVLIHDAARCLTPVAVFDRVIAAVRAGAPAAVPGIPVVDTIKQVDDDGHVITTPTRAQLRAIQTPQAFQRAVIERAHVGAVATDDAALVERLGERVVVVAGDALALKVTTAADLDVAGRILAG